MTPRIRQQIGPRAPCYGSRPPGNLLVAHIERKKQVRLIGRGLMDCVLARRIVSRRSNDRENGGGGCTFGGKAVIYRDFDTAGETRRWSTGLMDEDSTP
jgi:hypothetical protein